jgi:hypothetical protein
MRALGISALIVTVVSAMYHWHIMRNGVMLVGENSGSFMDDVKKLPQLTVSFVCDPIKAVMSRVRAERIPAKNAEIAA